MPRGACANRIVGAAAPGSSTLDVPRVKPGCGRPDLAGECQRALLPDFRWSHFRDRCTSRPAGQWRTDGDRVSVHACELASVSFRRVRRVTADPQLPFDVSRSCPTAKPLLDALCVHEAAVHDHHDSGRSGRLMAQPTRSRTSRSRAFV